MLTSAKIHAQEYTLWTQHESGFLHDDFGTNGIVLLEGNLRGRTRIIEQHNGNIIIASTIWDDATFSAYIRLYCLRKDGTVVETFADNGVLTLKPVGFSNDLSDIIQLDNGNLLILGIDLVTLYHDELFLFQIDENGNFLDNHYDNGIYNLTTRDGWYDIAFIRLANGEIIAGGTYEKDYFYYSVLFKISSDGVFDSSLGVKYSPNGEKHGFIDLIPLKDGTFLTFDVIRDDITSHVKIDKYLSDASLDSTFMPASQALYGQVLNSIYFIKSLVTPAEDIYIVHYTPFLSIVKMDKNGILDSTFGDNGFLIQTDENFNYTFCDALLQDDNESVYLIGHKKNNNYYNHDIATFKLTESFELDQRHSADGIFCYNVLNVIDQHALSSDYTSAVLKISADEVYIAGYSTYYSDSYSSVPSLSKLSLSQHSPPPTCNIQKVVQSVERLSEGTFVLDFTLTTDAYMQFVLFDMHGRPVHEWESGELLNPSAQFIEFDIPPTLPDGVYMMSLQTNSCAVTQPVVIIH